MNSESPRLPKKRVTLIGKMDISYLVRTLEECACEHYRTIELSMEMKKDGEYYTIFQAEDE